MARAKRERKPEAPEAVLHPDAGAVGRLAEKARVALMALYAEVTSAKIDVPLDAMEAMAWSTARLGVDVLEDLVLRPRDAGSHARQESVRALDQLRHGKSVLRALLLTAEYATSVRGVLQRGKAERSVRGKPLVVEQSVLFGVAAKIRTRLAKEYMEELRSLGLEELEEKHDVSLDVVAAELAGEGEPKTFKPRGPAMTLARVLVLHRRGALDEDEVKDLASTFAKAKVRNAARLARRSSE